MRLKSFITINVNTAIDRKLSKLILESGLVWTMPFFILKNDSVIHHYLIPIIFLSKPIYRHGTFSTSKYD